MMMGRRCDSSRGGEKNGMAVHLCKRGRKVGPSVHGGHGGGREAETRLAQDETGSNDTELVKHKRQGGEKGRVRTVGEKPGSPANLRQKRTKDARSGGRISQERDLNSVDQALPLPEKKVWGDVGGSRTNEVDKLGG